MDIKLRAKALIKSDEGEDKNPGDGIAEPYLCTAGEWTWVWGININNGLDQADTLLVLREGANFATADKILDRRIEAAYQNCRKIFPRFDLFTDNRQVAFINMMYQLGYRNFYGFHGMIDHALNGRWAQAADAALDSKWAKNDSPNRAQRIAAMIREG